MWVVQVTLFARRALVRHRKHDILRERLWLYHAIRAADFILAASNARLTPVLCNILEVRSLSTKILELLPLLRSSCMSFAHAARALEQANILLCLARMTDELREFMDFLLTLLSCFLTLLIIAAILWKVKQKYDMYRRRQVRISLMQKCEQVINNDDLRYCFFRRILL